LTICNEAIDIFYIIKKIVKKDFPRILVILDNIFAVNNNETKSNIDMKSNYKKNTVFVIQPLHF
jgi:hypothetical protein